jgi:hypothetical protein
LGAWYVLNRAVLLDVFAHIEGQIPLGQNIHVEENRTVTDGTYAGFLVLTFLGAILSLFLVDVKNVLRHDGSRVIVMKNPTWKTEVFGLVEVFRSDPWIVCLFPLFFVSPCPFFLFLGEAALNHVLTLGVAQASNFFYGYQFNAVNGAKFKTRTKALNNVLYWTMQIVGAYIFGYALDYPNIRRSVRARIAWVTLFVLTFAIWGGGYVFQKGYTREETDDTHYQSMDWKDNGYVGVMFLYMFYGFYDAAFQTCAYW